MKKNRGFSLVELMITLCVIGIVASAGGMSINNQLPKYRLRGDAQRISMNLMKSRLASLKQGVVYALELDLDSTPQIFRTLKGNTNKWRKVGANATVWTEIPSSRREMSFGVNIPQATKDTGANVSTGKVKLVYAPSGSSYGGSVIIQNGSGLKAVYITKATGRVKIENDEV